MPLAFAQDDETVVDPLSVPPDVVINVKEYPNGAEMVTVTVLKEGYPEEYLRAQCNGVGTETGSPIRGLQISAATLETEQDLSLGRASFATDDLINRGTGALNLQPIIRAFVGVPDPWTVKSFLITFEEEVPRYQTLQSISNESVAVVSQAMTSPTGVEYRVLAFTQEPSEIEIPSLVPDEPQEETAPVAEEKLNPLVFVMLGIAAISGGALVYFLALRPSSRR